jgi:DNA polymerase/3'-5' exonuclease PolX
MIPMKQKFPRADALAVVIQLMPRLEPACLRLIVAGSLRRRKELVGDIEILYIPRFHDTRNDLFKPTLSNLTDIALQQLITEGILEQRRNAIGTISWGEKNKLARHLPSGIPIDLFAANSENWFNYLVCRTGPGESNIRISSAALAKGWKWKPYSPGFLDAEHHLVPVHSEREVFELVGLPYLEPCER